MTLIVQNIELATQSLEEMEICRAVASPQAWSHVLKIQLRHLLPNKQSGVQDWAEQGMASIFPEPLWEVLGVTARS